MEQSSIVIGKFIDPTKKRPWRRRVYDSSVYSDTHQSAGTYKIMTQEDFLNEVYPAAHAINSPMLSRRPIYGELSTKDKNGKPKWGIVGYDEVESTPIPKQQEIISKKVSHFAGDGFWVSSESEGEENEKRFGKITSWIDIAGLKAGYIAVINSAMHTGDGALYVYQDDDAEDPIKYEVYGYEEGSVLYPSEDLDGKKTLARRYTFNGHDAVDLFSAETIETWMKIEPGQDPDITLPKYSVKSADDWVLVRRKAGQAGNLCQCIYFRFEDIPTGPVQGTIERLEGARTYVGEHLKGTAMPILFVKAEKLTSLPPSKFANRTIGVKGTTDSLSHADAKFLAPPDASNIADMHIDGLEDSIRSGALSVKIDPEVIKQGSDSSATMRILYAPEVQWAQIHWPEIYKSVKQLMLVFKALVGKVEGEASEYAALRISVGQNIWIPQNAAEALKMELDAVYGRIKSRKAAIQDSGNTHRGDYEQTNQEWRDELQMKAEIPAKVEAEYGVKGTTVHEDDNPNLPVVNITNQAKGKTIAQRQGDRS